MEQNIINKISSKICSHCGGEADGWKCSKCGLIADLYNPLHWKECAAGGKMQAKCKACGEAESNCKCAAKKPSI